MSDATNPLLQPSTLPFGLPDYQAIRPEHYLPAFRAGFAEQLAEVANITRVRSMPTFENTLEALERSGELLDRVAHAFYTVSSADATPEIQAIDEELAPLMAAHEDAITLDAALYARVAHVYDQREALGLDSEQRYLVERYHREMTHAGAGLDDDAKAQLTGLNQKLSVLTNTFERNLLSDTNDLAVVFDSAAELEGPSAGELSSAARAAADRGLDGRYLLTLPLFTGHPALARLAVRESRRRIMAASRARGSRDNGNDNRPVLREIVRLRAERARLLGYPSHAAYITADETAGSPRPSSGCCAGWLRRPPGTPAPNGTRSRRSSTRPSRSPSRGGPRLGVLHRARAHCPLRHRHRRPAPLVRGGAGAAGRRVLRGDLPVRGDVPRAAGPRGLSPAGPRVRGAQRRRLPWASTCSISTPATPSAAGHG